MARRLNIKQLIATIEHQNNTGLFERAKMSLLDNAFISVNCPRCGYATDIELLSIRLRERFYCSCCKARIQLEDADASFHRAQKEFDSAMEDFARALKKL